MFKAFTAPFFLFGWLSSLIAALPTTSLLSISISSEDITWQLNDTNISTLNASQIIHYSIPQTQVALIIYTANSIGGPAMHDTLESCLVATHAAMFKHGDVYMFPDPYLFQTPPTLNTGLEIRTYSTMVPGLKWIDLANMLQGIEQVMWQRAIYKEAHVKMYHEASRLEMGIADLYKSPAIKPEGIASVS